jgi:dihydroorotase
MVHVIDMRPALDWLLPYLGPGDIVTHCFHGNEGGILGADGRVLPAAAAARSAACGSTWATARAASPTTSRAAPSPRGSRPTPSPATCTRTNVDGPVFDQATHALQAAAPGHATRGRHPGGHVDPGGGRPPGARIGALAAGREADVSVFELREGSWPLPDAVGATETVERLLVPRLAIRAGQARELAEPVIAGGASRPGRAHRDGAGR